MLSINWTILETYIWGSCSMACDIIECVWNSSKIKSNVLNTMYKESFSIPCLLPLVPPFLRITAHLHHIHVDFHCIVNCWLFAQLIHQTVAAPGRTSTTFKGAIKFIKLIDQSTLPDTGSHWSEVGISQEKRVNQINAQVPHTVGSSEWRWRV